MSVDVPRSRLSDTPLSDADIRGFFSFLTVTTFFLSGELLFLSGEPAVFDGEAFCAAMVIFEWNDGIYTMMWVSA